MENEKETKNPETGERTFTQEEVNRIIGERLAKEKAKGDTASAEREQQLAERERQLANREALFEVKDKLKEMGLPAELLPVLNVQDKAALDTALEALKKYIQEEISDKGYKVIPNILPKGEPNHNGVDYQIQNAFKPPKD